MVRAPREAFLGEAEAVPVDEAVGRVSAESIAGYPPGIPALLPGERITAEVIDYLRELRRRRRAPARRERPGVRDHLRPARMSLEQLVDQRALAEDVGAGDVTTEATVDADARAARRITQKAPGVIFGLDAAEATFRRLDPDAAVPARSRRRACGATRAAPSSPSTAGPGRCSRASARR